MAARLADLKMPGALEALDGVLAGVDGGGSTAAEAMERLSWPPRPSAATAAASNLPCAPAACRT